MFLLVGSFLIGLIGYFLLWGNPISIFFPIIIAICMQISLFALVLSGITPSPLSLPLIILASFFALMAGLTSNRPDSLINRLDLAFTFFYIALWCISYFGGGWTQFGFSDYFINFVQLLFSILVRPFIFLRGRSPSTWVIPTIRFAIIIAAPVAVCVTILLARGDLIYHRRLVDFIALVSIDVPTSLLGVLFWIYMMSGALIHARWNSANRSLRSNSGPVTSTLLPYFRTSIALVSILVPIGFFCLIQFGVGLMGNNFFLSERIPANMYFINGFPWLVTTAGLSFVLVYVFSAITQYTSGQQREWHLWINTLILGLVIFVLLAAGLRLFVDPYWIGRQEAQGHMLGLVGWLGGLFMIFVGLDWSIYWRGFVPWHRDREFPFAALLWTTFLAAVGSLLRVTGLI